MFLAWRTRFSVLKANFGEKVKNVFGPGEPDFLCLGEKVENEVR